MVSFLSHLRTPFATKPRAEFDPPYSTSAKKDREQCLPLEGKVSALQTDEV